jgi:putative membrane protein
MGYFAWIVAGILLGNTGPQMSGMFEILVRPIVAAFVMAQWDVVMDPPGSTIAKAWVWHDGGGYFGVPLSNYFGWLLTSWLFYQAFAIYLGRSQLAPQPIGRQRAFGFVAILLYLGSGITHVTPWLMGQTGEVIDAANHVWRVQDVRESAVIVMLFTMLFTSVLAALRLAEEDSRSGQHNGD